MNELVYVLGGLLPLVLFLCSIVLYFQNRSDRNKSTEGPAVNAPLPWKEMEDLRQAYALMPLDRLVQLFSESGLKTETRDLIAQELKSRGWV